MIRVLIWIIFFFLIFLIKAYVVGTHLNNMFLSDFLYKSICCGTVGTHLNCINDSVQMGTHNICLYKEVDKKYTGCDLKTEELLDYALIGLCAVISLNAIFILEFLLGDSKMAESYSTSSLQLSQTVSTMYTFYFVLLIWRSQLIWICTICHAVCEFISTIWIK